MKKIVFSIILTVTLSLVLFGWILDRLVDSSTIGVENQHLQLRQEVLNGFTRELASQTPSGLDTKLAELNSHFKTSASLEKRADYAFPDSLNVRLDSDNGLSLSSELGPYLLSTIDNHEQFLLRMPLPKAVGDTPWMDVMLTLMLYVSISLVLVAWFLPLIKRLNLMTNAAAKFGAGRLDTRIPITSSSYIKDLEISFNQMANKIEHLLEDNRLLARSLSHDLRTPLSCFRFGLDASLNEPELHKKNQLLRRLEADLVNMEAMLNAFLEYASMERNSYHLTKSKILFDEFLTTVINDLKPLAIEQSVSIRCVKKGDLGCIEADNIWMYRALQNLIVNAIRFADKHIIVIIQTIDKSIFCYISDDGPGIAKGQENQIFDPFFKSDYSRNRTSNHFGLGLTIVNRVMQWHAFDIDVVSAIEAPNECAKGAIFRLCLNKTE